MPCVNKILWVEHKENILVAKTSIKLLVGKNFHHPLTI